MDATDGRRQTWKLFPWRRYNCYRTVQGAGDHDRLNISTAHSRSCRSQGYTVDLPDEIHKPLDERTDRPGRFHLVCAESDR